MRSTVMRRGESSSGCAFTQQHDEPLPFSGTTDSRAPYPLYYLTNAVALQILFTYSMWVSIIRLISNFSVFSNSAATAAKIFLGHIYPEPQHDTSVLRR